MMLKLITVALLAVLSSAFQLGRLPSVIPPVTSPKPDSSQLLAAQNQIDLEQETRSEAKEPPLSVVQRCYNDWNRGDMESAAACFAENFTYDDSQFIGTINGNKSELASRFQLGKNILPPKSKLVLDSIAVCPSTRNIGTRWHVEDENGATVPRTRGCSFYTVDASSGLISTGFKVSEMIVKPSKEISNGLVTSASKLMQSSTTGKESISSNTGKTSESPSSSIIETYFEAWNQRDMDRALDCFVDDCIYETEDPVFVDTFKGKDSLRKHLENNAAALPSACQIILDGLAIDSMRGTAGVKWHLEVNGVSIPNLRGCSMYTTDIDSGLLQSGFDVTEAPVKLPSVAQSFLTAVPPTFFQYLP